MSESEGPTPNGDPPPKIRCGDPLCPCQDGDVCHYVTIGETKAMMLPVSRHEKNLRQMRCVVSMLYPVTLHHCHGGSMLDLGPAFQNPGMAERNNPFFQIPIVLKYHVGPMGIDGSTGVVEWERTFGSQVDFLEEVNGQLDYDLWEQATLWSNENWKSATPVQSHLS